jgi:PilZ domain-containing protein
VDRLEEHGTVLLSLNTVYGVRQSLAATVLAISANTVALEALDKSIVLRLADVTRNVIMSFKHGTSLVAFKGTLRTVSPPGDLRFTSVDRASGERTRPTRIDLAAPVTIFDPLTGVSRDGTTINISIGGFLVEASFDLELGRKVEVRMMLPNRDGQLTSTATVVRRADDLIALRFEAPDDPIRAALAELVIAESRLALKRSRSSEPADHADF